jgi:hypothetical protein
MEIYYLAHPTVTEPVWIRDVYIGLTRDELEQLIGALEQLREEPERGTAAHYHVTADDMQEVTVWVIDPDEQTAHGP